MAHYLLEKLLFSDKIKKINMYNWMQDRYFVITTEKVYNVKKSKIKRSIVVSSPPNTIVIIDKRDKRDHEESQGNKKGVYPSHQ